MGKTYKKFSSSDDDYPSGRSGKHKNHASGKKTKGMKTLNSYVEEDYDDPFYDEVDGIQDEIFIQHIKNDDTN
jgi:hypothetical protein